MLPNVPPKKELLSLKWQQWQGEHTEGPALKVPTRCLLGTACCPPLLVPDLLHTVCAINLKQAEATTFQRFLTADYSDTLLMSACKWAL